LTCPQLCKDIPKRDQFAAQLVYFSDCILKNREADDPRRLADVRVVHAIYQSALIGGVVELTDMPAKKPTVRQEILQTSSRQAIDGECKARREISFVEALSSNQIVRDK
jgi:hypothetical protein